MTDPSSITTRRFVKRSTISRPHQSWSGERSSTAQQVAEKAPKSSFTARQQPFRKTHDPEELALALAREVYQTIVSRRPEQVRP